MAELEEGNDRRGESTPQLKQIQVWTCKIEDKNCEYKYSPQVSPVNPHLFFYSPSSLLCFYCFLPSSITTAMENDQSFKTVLVEGSSSGDPMNLTDNPTYPEHIACEEGYDSNAFPHKEPVPGNFTMEDLPQVQNDIKDLSEVGLLGKMVGKPIELKISITKTKQDWGKDNVIYTEIGNDWILFRFANSGDKHIVWSERPWHVQGDLLVLIPWKPGFDPYNEEIDRIDLWIRIPKFPPELFNQESARAFLKLNDLGESIKMEQSTTIRGRLKLARICISIDLAKGLKTWGEIPRVGGTDCYCVWYEDYPMGCACCGTGDHAIELCPLIAGPKKEIKIVLLMSPTHQNLIQETLAKAANQDKNEANPDLDTEWIQVPTKSKPKGRNGQKKSNYKANNKPGKKGGKNVSKNTAKGKSTAKNGSKKLDKGKSKVENSSPGVVFPGTSSSPFFQSPNYF